MIEGLPDKIVVPENLNCVWYSDYYDEPLKGICRQDGELCRFEIRIGTFDTRTYDIYRLSKKEKLQWLLRKKMFEWCVGYYCTDQYREQGVTFRIKRPKWFWNMVSRLYYRWTDRKTT